MDIQDQLHDMMSRRTFLGQTGAGIGTLALASLAESGSSNGYGR